MMFYSEQQCVYTYTLVTYILVTANAKMNVAF